MTPSRTAWAALLALLLAVESAPAADLHELWDRQCGGCHGHAATFARDALMVVDGRLHDRDGRRDIEAFLLTHNGGYPPDTIAAISEMLKAQATTPDLFRRKCGGCHETAAQLVREQVIERDGELVGIVSGRRLAEFLPDHSKLSDEDADRLLRVLARIAGEVRYRP